MPATPPLTPEALQVLAAAFLATASPKRLRRMRAAIEEAGCLTRSGVVPINPEKHAAVELVLTALDKAERQSDRIRRAG